MGCKAAETTHNIDNKFGPGTASEHTEQQWFKKFCKETRILKMKAQWLAIRSWQWPTNRIFEADSLTTTQEVAEELNVNRSTVIELEANWKGWKAR